jgi:hypothetical protein
MMNEHGLPPRHLHEAVAVALQPSGVRDQHADFRVAAREHEALDGFEETVLVVELRLEIRRVDRQHALSVLRSLGDRCPVLLERRQDRP